MLRKLRKIIAIAEYRGKIALCFIFGHDSTEVGLFCDLDDNFNVTKKCKLLHCKRCDRTRECEVLVTG